MNIDQDTLIAYSLGMLNEEDTLTIESHLREHPEDALQVKGYLNALTALVMSKEPEHLPKGAEESLLTRIRAEAKDDTSTSKVIQLPPKPKKHKNGIWLGLAAAIILGIAWFGFLQDSYNAYLITRELRDAEQREGAIVKALTNEHNEPIGTLIKQIDNSLLVVLNEDPPNLHGYQAWEIVEGVPKSLGIWKDRVMRLDSLAQGSIFGVTIEPKGGSVQPTGTPIVLFNL